MLLAIIILVVAIFTISAIFSGDIPNTGKYNVHKKKNDFVNYYHGC